MVRHAHGHVHSKLSCNHDPLCLRFIQHCPSIMFFDSLFAHRISTVASTIAVQKYPPLPKNDAVVNTAIGSVKELADQPSDVPSDVQRHLGAYQQGFLPDRQVTHPEYGWS